MKTRNTVGFMVAIALVTLIPPLAVAQVTQRPIQEFLDAQGTFCFPDGQGGCAQFVDPPMPNFLAFRQEDPERCAVVDYAGLADKWIQEASGGAIAFGTAFTGGITERPLPDGGVEVHVRLLTRHALTWVLEGCALPSDPVLFGHRATEVLDGAEPAFGDAHLDIVYDDVGPMRPIVDLVQLLAFPLGNQALNSATFSATASGPLTSAFGVADGTPGRARIVSVTRVDASRRGALRDSVPVVRIDLRVIAK